MSGTAVGFPTLHWRRGRRLHVFRIARQRPLIQRCSYGGCDHLQDLGTSKRRLHSTWCSCRFCGSLPQHTILTSQVKPSKKQLRTLLTEVGS
ncbi:hypothetical protein NDU88_011003 [Pleurodeles waltl]|uniref:Uncharacterized protein n=1 Tax=Pleurodeles waltl TaxID=8319 RepID=A0AAV7Q0C4_PLEWA|nr:hypothetical protein NDU88_011003 [Pleurodeles waltl]